MPKTGKASVKKAAPKASKSKTISKKSASPAKRSSKSSSKNSKAVKWGASYEKKIRMFKTQPDYFQLNAKYQKA